MNKRKELSLKIKAHKEQIKQLNVEIEAMEKESLLLCDETQQYFEEEVDVVVRKRPKKVEKQIRGYIKWKEYFKDEGTGENIELERHQLVRVNGERE